MRAAIITGLLVIASHIISQPTRAEARLAIIIDDIGYNQSLSERAARLPGAFTLSILPFTPHGLDVAHLAHRQGKELMLHAPMSNLGNIPLGRGGLYSSMGRDAFVSVLRQDLASLPFIKGVNNHMGSRLTQEAEPMAWLMGELKNHDLYFVDSRTSAQTRAFDVAQAHKIPSLKRDVFLDDIDEKGAITNQLVKAMEFARERGSAVAIGHPYMATLAVLENIQPLLSRYNVKLVAASQLLGSQSNSKQGFNPRVSSLKFCAAPPQVLWPKPNREINIQMFTSMTINDFLVIN